MPTVYERIKDIVVEKLGVDEGDINEGASFVDDLGADSLDLVELIMAFEEEFGTDDSPLEISDEDAEGITNVQLAINYLKKQGVEDE